VASAAVRTLLRGLYGEAKVSLSGGQIGWLTSARAPLKGMTFGYLGGRVVEYLVGDSSVSCFLIIVILLLWAAVSLCWFLFEEKA
jgi:hypothetical protein